MNRRNFLKLSALVPASALIPNVVAKEITALKPVLPVKPNLLSVTASIEYDIRYMAYRLDYIAKPLTKIAPNTYRQKDVFYSSTLVDERNVNNKDYMKAIEDNAITSLNNLLHENNYGYRIDASKVKWADNTKLGETVHIIRPERLKVA